MNYVGNPPAPAGVILVGDTNPVGMIGWFHSQPTNWLALNGQVVSKTGYGDLWTYAQGFLTADQVTNPGLYKSIDGSTFALPNLSGLFVRGSGSADGSHVAAALGVKQADANLSHVHTAGGGFGFQTTQGGPAYGSAVTGLNSAASTDASGGVEARPINVALVPCVKALPTTLMASSSAAMDALLTRVAALEAKQNTIVPLINATGTVVTFTGIPAGIRKLWVHLLGVSSNGSSLMQAQLGEAAGSYATTGYQSNTGGMTNAGLAGTQTNGFTTGFTVGVMSPGYVHHGLMSFVLGSNNTWFEHGVIISETTAWPLQINGGSKVLPGVLDRIRFTMVNGTDVFDAGQFGISYE